MREIRGRLAICGALFAFLAAVVVATPALRAETPKPNIHVFSCTLSTEPHNALLTVRFRNDSTTTLSSILWRVKYGSGYIDFPDHGTFAPGAVTVRDRSLFWSLLQGKNPIKASYAGLPFPENCAIIETKTAEGAEWGTPSAPDQAFSVPTALPDDATPIPASFDNPLRDPIGIIGCQYAVGVGRLTPAGTVRGRAELYVRFRNLSQISITRVVFRVPYASSAVDFVEGGTFAPGVFVASDRRPDIEPRKLSRDDLPMTLPWLLTSLDEPQNCTTVNVQYADGTTWQNPTAGPTTPPLPSTIPGDG